MTKKGWPLSQSPMKSGDLGPRLVADIMRGMGNNKRVYNITVGDQ